MRRPEASPPPARPANQRLATAALKDLLSLAGNKKCFDCDKAFALSSEVWANVAYGACAVCTVITYSDDACAHTSIFRLDPAGILLCTKCAAFHDASLLPRGCIRSVVMDYLTPRQAMALRLGTNGQLKGFFQRQRIDNTSPELLYKLGAAAFYRRQIALELQRRMGPSLAPGVKTITDSMALKLMRLLLVDGNDQARDGTGEGEFSIKLENLAETPSPLGLTLTETHGGRAVVQRVSPDGIAIASGIRAGDYIVAAGKGREWRYSKVLPRISDWASASLGKANGKGRSRMLALVVWRPQWRPDAFIMETVRQLKRGGGGFLTQSELEGELEEEAMQRTGEVLEANERVRQEEVAPAAPDDEVGLLWGRDVPTTRACVAVCLVRG